MPRESEFQKDTDEASIYKEDDPSKHYDILKKIGVGGFGKVFLCKKIDTGMECALKYVDPKNEKDKEIIRNEIALMSMSDNDCIIKYFETFLYRGRLWIFMEYMDMGCLTPIVEDCKGNIPEEVIHYISI